MGVSISDFSDQQVKAVQKLINQHYNEEIELHLGDSEIQTDPNEPQSHECPIIFWTAQACNFMVIRTAEDQYRTQYFYNPHEQFSTHQQFFTDVEDCVMAVLSEQANYQREVENAQSGVTGVDIN